MRHPTFATLLLSFTACATTPPPSPTPTTCRAANPVGIPEGLADDHACASWLDRVRGSVGAFSMVGSFTVVSRATPSGLGLVISAAHTQGTGSFGPVNTAVVSQLNPPATEGVLKLHVPPVDGTPGRPDLSAFYMMFHDDIPAAENADHLATIHPRHDFFLGLVDGQRVVAGDGPFPEPAPRRDEQVPLYDPQGRTTAAERTAAAIAGQPVMLVGYPQVGPVEGAFSVGPVLTDADAVAALEALRAAGDDEGNLPYDPEVEFLVSTRATTGMSGGGVFDEQGRYLGVMVRASLEAPHIVRVVRISHIARRMGRAVGATPSPELAPFLDPQLLR